MKKILEYNFKSSVLFDITYILDALNRKFIFKNVQYQYI